MNVLPDPSQAAADLKHNAFRFVVLLGIVSLCADMTYEGARSITGPFLQTLGASAMAVGVVAGFGELLGYGLRIASGYLTDRTQRYWTIAFTGYAVNLLAVPLLALAGRWEVAAFLMMFERLGKAIRAPARDAMLSHAARQIGRGAGFGLHEALDQIGAVTGPLIVTLVLWGGGGYRMGFALLLLPALGALGLLTRAATLYPHSREFETKKITLEGKGFPRVYWTYLGAVACIAAGYADFPLIGYHFKKMGLGADQWIAIAYAVANAVDAPAAILFGRLYDKKGLSVLIWATVLSAPFALLAFSGSFALLMAGVVLCGIGMGAQESVMRAAIGEMVPPERRGSAYGIFNTGYGVAWFIGSAAMGGLYDLSVTALVVFSVALQLAALPVLALVCRQQVSPKGMS